MRTLLLCSIIGLGLSGCASAPLDPWQDLDVNVEQAVGSIDCGRFPMPITASAAEIIYDEDGVNALEAYRVCSEANEAIVGEHAAQIGQLKIARKALVEAGQSQRNIAEMRQTMLADERRHHLFQSAGYWVLILGAVAL